MTGVTLRREVPPLPETGSVARRTHMNGGFVHLAVTLPSAPRGTVKPGNGTSWPFTPTFGFRGAVGVRRRPAWPPFVTGFRGAGTDGMLGSRRSQGDQR
ncbi:hypothetical protein [Streptosporangium vulgare]|uniref:Uncharacterized protein n=1 Tax=Streptosporangium vulgare TaxID=46190 RepID=A0ABV5TH32_9ACTN